MKFSEFNVAVNTSQIDFIVGYKGLQNFRISPSDLVGIYSSLNFISDSGSGTIDLGTQAFSILGTANEIETSGANQTLTIGLPDNVTITGELTVSGTGQSSFGGQLTIPATPVAGTDAASKSYVDSQVTIQDLDFQGDSGTGAVDLDSQIFILSGTANEIETSASGQTITIGLPSDVTIGNDLTVTSELTVSGAGQSSFSGQVTIPLTPTANTDAASKGYVDSQITAQDLDFQGDSGTGQVDLDSQIFTVAGTSNEIETSASNQTITIGLPDDVTVTGELTVSGTGQSSFGGQVTIPATPVANTDAASKGYVDGLVTAQDLDITDGTNNSSVDLDSQTLTFTQTANETTVTVSAQEVTIGLPNDVTISGTYTGTTFAGQLDGSISSATTATTQGPNDNSTKVATTAYVDTSAGNYLPLSGGTMSGNIAMGGNDISGGGTATFTTFVGALTGNASTASALAASGNITLTGDTTSTGGPYTYTSGGNVAIATTIADTTVTGKLLTGVNLSTSQNIAATDTILEAFGYLQAQITQLPQGLVYSGTWNANTNTPTLASGTGTTGHFYIVSVAGSTNLDGITDWQVGDWAIFIESGATDTWQKIDNTSAITGTGTANSIAKWTGPSTLGTGLITDDGTTVTIGNSGDLDVTGDTDVTGDLAWGTSLTDTTNTISITKFVDEADGIPSNDNDTSIPTSAAVKDYVDTQIGTVDTLAEVLAIGNTTGGTDISVSSGDDITFAANSKTIFNSALSIYNTGTQSVIYANTNNLLIDSTTYATVQALSDIYLKPNGGNNGITITGGGAVTLYHNNASKLATTSGGVLVTGDINLTGTAIYKNSGTLEVKAEIVSIKGVTTNENLAGFTENGAVDLYYDNSKKLETTSSGVNTTGIMEVTSSGVGVIGAVGNTANDINIYSTTAGHNGLRMHVNGILPTDHTGTIIDNDADLGDPNYRFKNLYLGGSISSGALTISGLLTSTLAINQATLPDTPSEHVITLNPPTTTNYYGGGISWSEGTNTAASLGVYDAGSGGALGFYIATGNNTTLTQALTIDNSQDSTFAGTIASGNIAVTSAGNGEVSVTRTSGATILTQAQSALGRFGTTTNHNLQLMANNSGVLTISTAGNSTFSGSIQANGTFIELDSPSDALLIIDRAATSNVARLSWRNAGSEFFRAGIETSSNDLWSLLHTCGNGLYFDGATMTFGFGRDPETGITLPQGSTAPSKISWYDGSNTFAASIYANNLTDNLTFATKNASNVETVALQIDINQNVGIGSTPDYGKLQVDTSSGNNITMRKGTGTPALAFGGTNANEAVALQEGIAGGGIKFYNGSGTLASPTWAQTFIISSDKDVYNYQSANKANTFYGYAAGDYSAAGGSNTFMGYNCANNLSSGAGNVGIGRDVYITTLTGSNNTAVGMSSLQSLTSGGNNVAVGKGAGQNLTSGAVNTFVGDSAGNLATTASSITAVGFVALSSLTTGVDNTAIGRSAAASLSTGGYVVAIGNYAADNLSTNGVSTAIGWNALTSNTAGDNVAIGHSAGEDLTSGTLNTYIGNYAGRNATTSSYGIMIGRTAGNAHTTGAEPLYIGYDAGQAVTTGDHNTVIGTSAMTYGNGSSNTFVGWQSGFGVNGQNNSNNTAVGKQSMRSIQTGSQNTAMGRGALYHVSTGSYNVGIGWDAYQGVTTTEYNTGVGANTGVYQTGNYNTSIGYYSNYGVSGSSSGSYNAMLGYFAGAYNRGENNTFLGALAGRFNSTGVRNTIVGSQAGDNGTITGSDNTSLGFGSLHNVTTGGNNVTLGANAGFNNATGDYVTAVGSSAGYSFLGTGLTAIGFKAGYNHTADYDTYVGFQAGYATGSGGANVGVGFRALHDNSSGDSNVGIGYEALRQNTTGVANTCVGRDAGRAITTGSRNTMVGSYAGQVQTTSGDNTLIGYTAGVAISSGGANTLVGSYSGAAITTGNHNTMLGFATGDVQTTASYNTLLGNIAGTSITTGGNNTAVGHEACRFLTTGTTNTVIGLSALENGTTAYENVGVGYRALRNTSTGAGNTALGLGAGLNITTGGSNIAIGYSAMGGNAVTGGGNIAMGDAAGYNLQSGANNVLIGKNAGRSTSSTDSLAQVDTQSNQIQIGNKTHTDAKVNISWTIVSDKRDKTKIKELDKGLDFVENLKPVSYERTKNRQTEETDNKERYGFLAQDVLELEGENPVIVNNEDKDNLKLTSDYIIPILVNSIKELKAEIELLKSK